jgi:hypothetical protein
VETRNAIPLEGQYPENVQEYNARLNPVNEVAYDIAHDNRKAANSILSVIGLIERSDEEKPSRKVSSLENQIAIPIGIASDVFDEIVTIWVVNLAERLLVCTMRLPDKSKKLTRLRFSQ